MTLSLLPLFECAPIFEFLNQAENPKYDGIGKDPGRQQDTVTEWSGQGLGCGRAFVVGLQTIEIGILYRLGVFVGHLLRTSAGNHDLRCFK